MPCRRKLERDGLLDAASDSLERSRKARTDSCNSADDDDGDQGCNESVLDGRGTAFMTAKLFDEIHRSQLHSEAMRLRPHQSSREIGSNTLIFIYLNRLETN
jgi:hypothetical protein